MPQNRKTETELTDHRNVVNTGMGRIRNDSARHSADNLLTAEHSRTDVEEGGQETKGQQVSEWRRKERRFSDRPQRRYACS